VTTWLAPSVSGCAPATSPTGVLGGIRSDVGREQLARAADALAAGSGAL
jgi:hypothetical protein